MMNGCEVAFQTKRKITRMRWNEEFGLKFRKKNYFHNLSMSSSSLLTQKDQIHCPYCYRKVKHWGGLASHIQWSLACQVKHNNDNPQLPRTSHDPILTPNCHNTPLGCHDTPPGTGWHDPDGSDWDQDPGSSLGPGHTLEFEADDTDSGASPPTTHLKVIIDTNAGKPLEGCQETLWERFARQAGEGGYAPFESKEEWELSHWLSTEGLSQGAIDHFQKLKWVSHNFLFTH